VNRFWGRDGIGTELHYWTRHGEQLQSMCNLICDLSQVRHAEHGARCTLCAKDERTRWDEKAAAYARLKDRMK
jgi:hypothetical protein